MSCALRLDLTMIGDEPNPPTKVLPMELASWRCGGKCVVGAVAQHGVEDIDRASGERIRSAVTTSIKCAATSLIGRNRRI